MRPPSLVRTWRLPTRYAQLLPSSQLHARSCRSHATAQDGDKLIKEAGRPLSDNYPTTTYKNFLINLPGAAAAAAGPVIKAFAPARSAKKMVLLGPKFAEELAKEVESSQLPSRLGGVLDDGNQWMSNKSR